MFIHLFSLRPWLFLLCAALFMSNRALYAEEGQSEGIGNFRSVSTSLISLTVEEKDRLSVPAWTTIRKKTNEKRKRETIKKRDKKPANPAPANPAPPIKGDPGDPGPQGPPGIPGTGFQLESSPAQLTFQFNSNRQKDAEGVFVAVITLPDQTQMTIEGDIGPVGIPYGVYVGPDSLLGSYVVGYYVKSTTHPLDKSPIMWVTNSLTGDVYKTEFSAVTNGSNCDFKYYVNRIPDSMR